MHFSNVLDPSPLFHSIFTVMPYPSFSKISASQHVFHFATSKFSANFRYRNALYVPETIFFQSGMDFGTLR